MGVKGFSLDRILSFFKKIEFAKFMLIVFFASGFLLFAPDSLLTKLHIINFCNSHGTLLGVAFVLSAATVIVEYVGNFLKLITISALNRLNYYGKSALKKFNRLSPAEKQLLVAAFTEDDHSVELSPLDVITQKLVGLKYLYSPQYVDVLGSRYTLQPWVVTLFEKHPELLKNIPRRKSF